MAELVNIEYVPTEQICVEPNTDGRVQIGSQVARPIGIDSLSTALASLRASIDFTKGTCPPDNGCDAAGECRGFCS